MINVTHVHAPAPAHPQRRDRQVGVVVLTHRITEQPTPEQIQSGFLREVVRGLLD
jgi:hypothetical protein